MSDKINKNKEAKNYLLILFPKQGKQNQGI